MWTMRWRATSRYRGASGTGPRVADLKIEEKNDSLQKSYLLIANKAIYSRNYIVA
jgi:hypothetical protein